MDVPVGLLHLVEDHQPVGVGREGVEGLLLLGVRADVPGRRAQDLSDGRGVRVLGHVQHHRVHAGQVLGEDLGGLRLSRARGAGEEHHGGLGLRERREVVAHRDVHDLTQGPILALDPIQVLEELLPVHLHRGGQTASQTQGGPTHVLLGDRLRQRGSDGLGRRGVLDCLSTVDGGADEHHHIGHDAVHQGDGVVGSMDAVAVVLVGGLHDGPQLLVLDLNPVLVVVLVGGLEDLEDLEGLIRVELVDDDLGEPARERRVLLDLPGLLRGRGSDHVDVTTSQGGLHDLRDLGVGLIARVRQHVDLVDEQDHLVLRIGGEVDDLGDPLLDLPDQGRAGHQRSQRQLVDGLVLELRGDQGAVVGDEPSQLLDDGGLARAGRTGEYRVGLGLADQGTHQLLHEGVTEQHGAGVLEPLVVVDQQVAVVGALLGGLAHGNGRDRRTGVSRTVASVSSVAARGVVATGVGVVVHA